MSQFPHLTKGGVGRIGFDDLNRIMDATTAVESLAGGDKSQPPKILQGFFVKLLATSGTVGAYNLWTWSRIAVDSGTTTIATDSSLITSSLYAANGNALDLHGTAAVNDLAFVYEFLGLDAKRYFCIVATGGSGGGSMALRIDSSSGDPATAPVNYSVTQGTLNASGTFVADAGPITGTMWNRYEFSPYGHGQGLAFASGDLVPAALQGTVFGGLTAVIATVRYYICDVTNPMAPECAGSTDDSRFLTEYTEFSIMRAGL